MVKTIQYQKLTWWKNDSPGGAMKEAIANKLPLHIVVKSWTNKYGQIWTHLTPEHCLKLLEKNYGIYEVITSFPHKVYFDIDRHLNGTETDVDIFLDSCLKNIKEFFPIGDWAVSGSITEGVKQSYHIVSDSYVIHNKEERNIIQFIAKKLNFDSKVYSSNQNMKCINQSKLDGRVQKLLINDNFKAHCITSFINDYPTPITFENEEIKEEIQIEKSKKTFDIGTLPKLLFPTPENINWESLKPIDILGLLPCTKEHSFEYSHKIARFCFTNNLTIEHFLSWIKQKRNGLTQEFITKWEYHFKNIHKYPLCSIETIKPILAYYYPDIKKDIHLRKFKALFDYDLPSAFQYIKIDSLNQSHYNNNIKYTVLNLGMGSGKTAQTIDYLKMHHNFCWIGHRQSLHKNTYQRICEANIECVDYLSGSSKTKATLFNEANALSICINSLHYLNSRDYPFLTIVIDEIESLLDAFMGDFMKDKKNKNFEIFCNLIKNANKVILLDAFITNRTLNLIKAIDGKELAGELLYNEIPINKKIVFKTAQGNSACGQGAHGGIPCSEDIFNEIKQVSIDEICKSLENNKKVFIFYPYKKDMEQIAEVIKLRTNKKGLFYNADVDDAIKNTLNDVNTHWNEVDFVITNTCITCGVNFDLEGFDHVWIFLANFVKPREAIQVSARIRKLKTNTINVAFLGNLKNPNCYIDDTLQMNNKIYSIIYNDALVEDKAPRRKAFEIFCNKAGYKMVKESIIINKDICNEMTKLFDSVNVGFSFETIETISPARAENIENDVMGHIATMYDKLCLQKYYFVHEYIPETDIEKLAIIWNEKYLFFLNKLKLVLSDDHHIFKKIQLENKWGTIFPSDKIKNLKLSPTVIEDIFTNYKFRTLTRSSLKNQIFREIMNKEFENNVIITKQDNSKHFDWYFNEELDEVLPICFELLQCQKK
jgi:hypothetical protein